ncbi:ABC transporter ATP-binding protein [Numidum massiliense]|uniref:ABC transporter ATP-binding protein n=1 Tax=Numidum massiliense TaxID=1522315 RepID=UPI0006D5441C|nr:ABC transporter ATP-binding protein [Numidum massiliense]
MACIVDSANQTKDHAIRSLFFCERKRVVKRTTIGTPLYAIKRTDELLELVGLADAENRRISHYSGGMKQRLGIAQALIHRPKLVMLDEPVSALDPLGRRDVLNLLGQLKRETTVLFSTHVLHDAEAVSDSVLIMHEGQLKLSARLQEIRQKHQRGTVVIEGDEELAPLAKEWQRQGVISHFSQEGLAYKLVVDDLAQARMSLLQSLAAHRVSLSRFETGNTSLEQLFMEVVQS